MNFLKIELAELRGQVSVLRDSKKEVPVIDAEEQKAQQTKRQVMADANTLDDEQFQNAYKMTKLQGRT